MSFTPSSPSGEDSSPNPFLNEKRRREVCSDINDVNFRPSATETISAAAATLVVDDQDEDTPLLSGSSNMSINLSLTPGSPAHSYNSNGSGGVGATQQQEHHCHSLTPSTQADSGDRNEKAQRRLVIAIIMTAVFVVGEAMGGFLSNSLAILGDAAHMTSDLTAFIVAWVALKLSKKPPGKNYNFGYHRAEALGALLSVIIIWYLTAFLLYEAIGRIINPDFDVEPISMMIVAGCAIVFNILLLLVLGGMHGHSHGGGGGHSHGHNHLVEDEDDGGEGAGSASGRSPMSNLLNIRAAVIHVIGDFLQSIGVLISSIIIKVNEDYKIADPICTIIFAVIVVCTTLRIFLDTIHILMEGLPRSISYEEVQQDVLGLDGVLKVHDLRVWALTSDRSAASCHLVVEAGQQQERVLQKANQLLRSKYSVKVATIQVEQDKPEAMRDCVQCQPIA